MSKEWNNAINREFIEQLIQWSKSMKKDYTIHEVEEFYKEVGRYVCSEIYLTFDEDVEPDNK